MRYNLGRFRLEGNIVYVMFLKVFKVKIMKVRSYNAGVAMVNELCDLEAGESND